MSEPTRRIGYYFMDFTEIDTDERTFDKDLFKRLLVYINGLGDKDRVIKDTKANKAMDIESITMYQKDDIDYAKIIFKSCKFNHAKRMRMYAKDENNMNTIIDTNMVKRIEEITVDLKKLPVYF